MNFEVYIAAVLFTLSTILYGVVPWWKTVAGRILFSSLVALTLVIDLVALSKWLGDFPGRAHLRLFIYTVVLILAILVFFSIVYVQFKGATKNVRIRNPREPI